ncbi:hypothetical protein D3C76_801230 [compost metagenome]
MSRHNCPAICRSATTTWTSTAAHSPWPWHPRGATAWSTASSNRRRAAGAWPCNCIACGAPATAASATAWPWSNWLAALPSVAPMRWRSARSMPCPPSTSSTTAPTRRPVACCSTRSMPAPRRCSVNARCAWPSTPAAWNRPSKTLSNARWSTGLAPPMPACACCRPCTRTSARAITRYARISTASAKPAARPWNTIAGLKYCRHKPWSMASVPTGATGRAPGMPPTIPRSKRSPMPIRPGSSSTPSASGSPTAACNVPRKPRAAMA